MASYFRQDDERSPSDVIRHAVLLGDALQNIDLGEGDAESALVPRPRNPWKLTVLQAPQLLLPGRMRQIPADATHIAISLEGAWAIEASGLLQVEVRTIRDALATLARAADEFERIFTELIRAALETDLPTVVCTLVPARASGLEQQRVTATALSVFNDRILRLAVAASLSIVELRLVCNEDADYASETLLSRDGVRKAANVIRAALSDVSRPGGRMRVYF